MVGRFPVLPADKGQKPPGQACFADMGGEDAQEEKVILFKPTEHHPAFHGSHVLDDQPDIKFLLLDIIQIKGVSVKHSSARSCKYTLEIIIKMS